MSTTVITPLDAMRPLAHRHKWAMQVLVSFSNKGRCQVSLRTIARRAGQSLAWVCDNLKEMLALGYIERTRDGGAYIYTLAERFWRVLRSESATTGLNRESKNKKEIQNGKSLLVRCAPSDEDKAHVASCVLQAKAALSGKTVERVIHDERAWAAAGREEKYQRWLNSLEVCVGEVVGTSPAGWELADAIQQARKAGYEGKRPVFMRALNDFAKKIFNPWRQRRAQEARDDRESTRRWWAQRRAEYAAA